MKRLLFLTCILSIFNQTPFHARSITFVNSNGNPFEKLPWPINENTVTRSELTPEQIQLLEPGTKEIYDAQQKINAMPNEEIANFNNEITPTSDARPIKVKVNEEFIINLDENGTTGGSLKITALDPQFLKHTGTTFGRFLEKKAPWEYLHTQADQIFYESFCGAGGIARYHFLPLKKGITTLTIEYGRDWEPKAWRVYNYTIEIE